MMDLRLGDCLEAMKDIPEKERINNVVRKD